MQITICTVFFCCLTFIVFNVVSIKVNVVAFCTLHSRSTACNDRVRKIYKVTRVANCQLSLLYTEPKRQESRAVAMKPREAAAVLFALKLSPTAFSTSLRVTKLRKPGFRAPNIPAQKEFNAKWPFKVIQSRVFWSQWKADNGLRNTKY